MNLHESVAVVTGSNRGLGREFAAQLLERGAKKVYATARTPEHVQIPGITPLGLDITDPDSIARAAAIARDATLSVNNAGISTGTSLMDGDLAQIEREPETSTARCASRARSRRSWRPTAAGRSSTSSRCCRGSTSPPPVRTAPRRRPRGR